MMYMDIDELKMLCGEARVDRLLARGRIPLAKVERELVIMDGLEALKRELTGEEEEVL